MDEFSCLEGQARRFIIADLCMNKVVRSGGTVIGAYGEWQVVARHRFPVAMDGCWRRRYPDVWRYARVLLIHRARDYYILGYQYLTYIGKMAYFPEIETLTMPTGIYG
jgi:hypothetical protein